MAKKNIHVLIVDDEESIRDGCQQILSRMGYEVSTSGDGLAGLEMARNNRFDIILLDIRMPRIEGLEILRILKKEYNSPAKVIIITGFGTIQLAVEAMRLGARNFISKPFNANELKQAVLECLSEEVQEKHTGDILKTLIGTSDYIEELKDTIRRVAKTDSTVLITGESGTGKELVARTIHSLSSRADRHFIPVDCSSLVQNLMESELFGHIKGAAPPRPGKEGSRWLTRARCSLMRSRTSASRSRQSSCAPSRNRKYPGWEAPFPRRSTSD